MTALVASGAVCSARKFQRQRSQVQHVASFSYQCLPNANGPIHLGHVLEQIQTDIWVRFQRMRGNQAIYVCADDTHGTATMIKAEQRVCLLRLWWRTCAAAYGRFSGFLIAHKLLSTHSPENQQYSELIYNRLQEAGLIFIEEVEQHDPEKGLFLADRFVVVAPKCKTGSIWRQLRELRHLQCQRIDRS